MLTFLVLLIALPVLYYAIKFIISAMTPLIAIILAIVIVYIVICFILLRRK